MPNPDNLKRDRFQRAVKLKQLSQQEVFEIALKDAKESAEQEVRAARLAHVNDLLSIGEVVGEDREELKKLSIDELKSKLLLLCEKLKPVKIRK